MAGDQTHSQPDTWRFTASERIRRGSRMGERATEASRRPGTELSHRSTSNPASAHSTTGQLPKGGLQLKYQGEAKGPPRDPRAFSEMHKGERNSKSLSVCPIATKIPTPSFSTGRNWQALHLTRVFPPSTAI